MVSDSETYALAWGFVSPTLNISQSGTNAFVTWAAYPAGYRVQTTTNLTSAWVTNGLSSSVFTNSRNSLTLNATNALQFFRLRQPNF